MWRIQTRLEILSNQSWEIIIDGNKGYDHIGTYSSWEEGRNEIQRWLQSFISGYVNPDTWGNEGPSKDAVEDDARALSSIQQAAYEQPWQFDFDHDKARYSLILQAAD
jgi:hypothetical protein